MGTTDHGDRTHPVDQLFDAFYEELRSIAGIHMSRERAGHTLQPTAVVHEVYAKLARDGRFRTLDRTHFLAVASRAMRQVLIDYARSRRAKKRGVEPERVPLEGLSDDLGLPVVDSFLLVDALERLAKYPANGERKVKLVELICLGGFKVNEAADYLGVSRRTATRDWTYAMAWLRRELSNDGG